MRRAILLFVKYPEPGQVKTRLAATLGAERAADIYRRLVAEVLRRLPVDDEWVVVFAPAEMRAEVRAWIGGSRPGKEVRFAPQAEGDLGMRLERAFAEAFADGCTRVAAIGGDCIELDAAIFAETWRALDGHDAVLGPSFDGGYYLLALKQPCQSLFHGIDWSTAAVFSQTLLRARAAGLRVHALPRLHDVDTAHDWRRAAEKLNIEQ